MIDEKATDKIVERLVRRIEQANTYFLKKMGASIAKIRELNQTEAHQLVQILKYGGNYDDIIKEISEYTNLNIKDVDEIFAEYAKKDQAFAEKFYNYKNIPFVPYDQNTALLTQTNAISNIVKNEMYDFTRSNVIGYTIRDINGTPTFTGMKDTYNMLLDEALLNVGQGKETFDNAMKRILSDVGSSGLKTLEYESGRSVRLDSAVRMHLKGRLRELHNENQEIIGEEIGADGVEISVHGNPAPDHAEVQGRQFTKDEYAKLQAGKPAKDYKGRVVMIGHSKKGGYRPISEYNCYHYIFSIVLGVSEPEYSEKELEEINENNENGFDFDGEHYTNYEGTQLQRNIERVIREQKDIQILAKASGNDGLVAESQNKISILSRKYKELSEASGLPTKLKRMQVSGYRRTGVKKQQINNMQEIEYARKNNKIYHTTPNVEDIIKTNTFKAGSIAVGKDIANNVKYGTQLVIFKPEILQEIDKNDILFKGDGGRIEQNEKGFDNLMDMLKDKPKIYNEIKTKKDIDIKNYIDHIELRDDEPKELYKLLEENNIKYELYHDDRIDIFRENRKRKRK